ncbi:hypothetical protein VTJ83DRAFT_3486 [Remersonia thermophila]|uniref:Uncharacterized protein n=1 Tax=Remersonia thermophila TaxID=72144 RepID=A0ABR4DE45_9PEZI
MSHLVEFIVGFLKSQFRSIPLPTTSYAGRTVIVTGATGGLGLEAARHFTRLGAARLILACRSSERGEAARAEVHKSHPDSSTVIEVWPLDLASFESVRAFCRRAEKELDRLDVLLANAGMLAISEPKLAEGYEMQITVNVISNALLILILLPLLKRTAATHNVEPVVTVVSSIAHMQTTFAQQSAPHIFSAFQPGDHMDERYGTSKLLVILLVRELAERLSAAASPNPSPVIVNSAHPGLCKSDLFRSVPTAGRAVVAALNQLIGRSSEAGASALLAAVAGGRESHGKYVDSACIMEPSSFVRSEKGAAAQKKVWAELMAILDGVEPGVSGNVERALAA